MELRKLKCNSNSFFLSFTIIYNLIITWVSCDVLSSHVNQDITLLVFSGVVGSRTMCIFSLSLL